MITDTTSQGYKDAEQVAALIKSGDREKANSLFKELVKDRPRWMAAAVAETAMKLSEEKTA